MKAIQGSLGHNFDTIFLLGHLAHLSESCSTHPQYSGLILGAWGFEAVEGWQTVLRALVVSVSVIAGKIFMLGRHSNDIQSSATLSL